MKCKNTSHPTHNQANEQAAASLLRHHPCPHDPKLLQSLQILMYLRRLYHSLDVMWEKELIKFNLTPAQLISLFTVITNEGLSMSKLAELCLWNRSTASRIARSLQKKELITISQADGKTSALRSTSTGQSLAARYIAERAGEFAQSLAIISEEAEKSSDVYQWLKTCIIQLVGQEAADYVESTCKNFKMST